MKNLHRYYYIMALLFVMFAYQPVVSQTNSVAENEIKALVEKYFESWNAQNLTALMDCFGTPEGLIIAGGQTYTLDSLKVIFPRDYWKKRKQEKFWSDDLKIISESKTNATVQVTYSGRFTYTPTDTTWEFNRSAFMTWVVRKMNGKWKIVAFHGSAEGKQIPKPKN